MLQNIVSDTPQPNSFTIYAPPDGSQPALCLPHTYLPTNRCTPTIPARANPCAIFDQGNPIIIHNMSLTLSQANPRQSNINRIGCISKFILGYMNTIKHYCLQDKLSTGTMILVLSGSTKGSYILTSIMHILTPILYLKVHAQATGPDHLQDSFWAKDDTSTAFKN